MRFKSYLRLALGNPLYKSEESVCLVLVEGSFVMVASYLSSSYLISASILSNLGAHLISYLIYGCGLVSSSRTFWYILLHSDVIDDIT